MMERKLIYVAAFAGAAWWLVRVIFSRVERRKIDAAMSALDSTRTLRCSEKNVALPQST
jgi:hypothetical protein